ncbi:hypothetical protein QJS66_14160 [Kocuria rhizophila]|nr:hypothetical protein QJS66_14160 [Kocuria rhizophila]
MNLLYMAPSGWVLPRTIDLLKRSPVALSRSTRRTADLPVGPRLAARLRGALPCVADAFPDVRIALAATATRATPEIAERLAHGERAALGLQFQPPDIGARIKPKDGAEAGCCGSSSRSTGEPASSTASPAEP